MKPGQHLYHVQPVATRFKSLSIDETDLIFSIYQHYGRGGFTVRDITLDINPDCRVMSTLRKFNLHGHISMAGSMDRARLWTMREETIARVERSGVLCRDI